MINYIYDGSFEGLLTAVYESFILREMPDGIIPSGDMQESLFNQNKYIVSDSKKADRLLFEVKDRISQEALENILYLFLSEIDGAGMFIYNYLSLGWKVGSKLHLYLSDDRVLKVHQICKKVMGERHRMLGLIRFKLLKGNVYYGPIEPDYNITALLAPHFVKRFAMQDFIIHDVKRDIAVLYNREKWIITEFSLDCPPVIEEDEVHYEHLWKEYCKSIAITNRYNPKLQRKNMPARYWKYLTEMQPCH